MKISQILSLALMVFAFVSCENAAKEANTVKEPAVRAATTTTNAKEVKNVDTEETKVVGKLAAFEFEKTEHEFGTINQGDVVQEVFKFKNTGEVPLVISDIKVTCGCTTPSYTKEPVAPGENGEILVKFNSKGKRGQQTKVITVMANVENGRSLLRIKTNVLTDDAPAGPYKQ